MGFVGYGRKRSGRGPNGRGRRRANDNIGHNWLLDTFDFSYGFGGRFVAHLKLIGRFVMESLINNVIDFIDVFISSSVISDWRWSGLFVSDMIFQVGRMMKIAGIRRWAE